MRSAHFQSMAPRDPHPLPLSRKMGRGGPENGAFCLYYRVMRVIWPGSWVSFAEWCEGLLGTLAGREGETPAK